MMKSFFVAFLVIFLSFSGSYGMDIVLDNSRNGNTDIVLTSDGLNSKAGPVLEFRCHITKLVAEDVETPAGIFTDLAIPRFQRSGGIGAPALPVMNKIVEIPLGSKLVVKALDYTTREYKFEELGITHKLMPRQPSHPKDGTRVPFVYEEGAYMHKAYQQGELVSVEDLGIMRSSRLALVKVSPVAYNPVEGKIKVYNDVRIELMLKGADIAKTMEIKKNYSTPAFNWISKEVVVPPSLTLRDEGYKGQIFYLIIADRMFEKDLKPFVDWKIKKGFKVEVAYTDKIGGRDEIKAYIAKKYNEKPAPSYVLFVGDNDQIPAFRGMAGSHITDLYYVTVTPGDKLPDILYGRFSARNSEELIPQIDKTLEYEQYKFADPSFLKDVVLIAGWDYGHTYKWGWPQIKYGMKYYFNAEHGMPNVHSFLTTGSHQYEPEIKSSISNGCAFVNYTAHGAPTVWADPGFDIRKINSLENKGKYPFIIGNCCLTNKFEVGNCFGEAWLRAKDRGAIGYIGGSNSTYWDEDLWWGNGYYQIESPNNEGNPPLKEETGDGAYDGVFSGKYVTNGAVILAGNLAVQESNSPRKLYYWEIYHLMGDPSVMTYFGIPSKMEVEYENRVEVSRGEFEVKAPAGALVSVTKNGDILGVAYADNNGVAKINFKNVKGGGADITITGKNYQPYMGKVEFVD